MTTDEVIRSLRANVQNQVALTYADGKTENVLVINVDDEGVVFDLVKDDTRDNQNTWWTNFGEVADVQPIRGKAQ